MKPTLLCLILLAETVSIPTASAQSFFGRNLIVNPGAEQGGAASAGEPLIRPIPGWTPVGNFNLETYGSNPVALPTASTPGPPNRGARYFSGGPDNASSSVTQDIQVPSEAFAAIDAGAVRFDLSAWLGGFGSEDDSAALTLRFNSTAIATLGPVRAQDRQSVTSFINRTASGIVPAGTRNIQLTLAMTRVFGVYNDGYADELSLILTAAMTCSTSVSVTPSLRAEGTTEQVGDLTLTCINGAPAPADAILPRANITVFLNTTVTTRLKSIAGGVASEALLFIDEPNSGLPGTSSAQLACDSASGCSMTGTGNGVGTYSGAPGRFNIFQGVVSANSVTFQGVPIDPPGSAVSRVFRFTGVRVNSSAFTSTSGAVSILATISANGAVSIPTSNPSATVGFVQKGLSVSLRDGSNAAPLTGSGSVTAGSGPVPSGAPSAFVRFSELFGTAAKTRTTAPFAGSEVSPAPVTQNVPGTIYNSESSITFRSASITVAPADAGTRFKAAFRNLPAGVSVWVAVANNGASPQLTARLIASEAAAFTPVPPSVIAGGFSIAQIPLANGNGTATWEVLGTNPNAVENFDFPMWFVGSGSVNLIGSVDGSLAPNPVQGAISSSGAGMASSTLPIPRFADTSAPAGISRVLSQIVDGGAWKTTIILVSVSPVQENFTLRFWDENGAPRSIPLGPDGLQSQVTGSIPAGGSRTIQTDGLGGSALASWAELLSSNSVTGFAIFRQRVDGRPDQEAAVPLVSATGRFALPFDNTQGFVTSAALVNTNSSQTASSSAVFRAEDGSSILQAPVNLSPRSHTPFALPDLFPGVSNRRGVAEFSFASPDVTALGLRFNSGGAFTSFPALSFQDSILSAPSRNLSQLVDGGGWNTTFVLANMDTVPVAITLRFWKEDGSQMRLLFEGVIGGASDTLAATIGVGGTLTLITQGVDAVATQGWAELTSPGKIGGLAVFRQRVPGRPDQEAAVPITTSVSRFVLPFDNTQGFVTSMALINTNGTRVVSVSVVIRDETGTQIATDALVLDPRRHASFTLPDRFPVVANRRGVAEFSSTTADLSGLGLRFDPGGAFTSFPAFPK
jgi:hypothetical protein